MPTLPLDDIVKVEVNVSPKSALRSGFNLGLIIGSTAVISTEARVKIYSSLPAMIDDGFNEEDPEYKAASVYFSQKPRPDKVAIGFWDKASEETIKKALNDCRIKNNEWYGVFVCDTTKQTILDAAEYIEAAKPDSVLFYTTKDADVAAGTAGNVMETLKGLEYSRTFGQYSTNDYAAVAILGYAMGANTGGANSAFTLAYKKEVGILPEPVDDDQLKYILGVNGNIYVNQGSQYNLLRQGTMANGVSFDEILGLDMLANNIQLSIMDVLTGSRKVPQTEDGVTTLMNAIDGPCKQAFASGFLNTGIWMGEKILDLDYGDMLSQGYLIQAESIYDQPQADRDARKSPPIYVALKLAGAIEFALIKANVNR